jgi:predicted GTPase
MAEARVVILGAAGRDFHDFNVLYRGRPEFKVVAFTASQIPDIAGRRYPPSLAGPGYPEGIPIVPEEELDALLRREPIDLVVMAYSDLPHEEVMHKASRALARGASFLLPGPTATALRSRRPVVSVGAVRTGAGKSPLTRFVARWMRRQGQRVAIVRHPMPYGDLEAEAVQRFATLEDLDRAHCTVEEREEYEPHLRDGGLVFAGVDYARILERAEAEADLILWDGGNNDLPFFATDLHLVVADPHRPGHELAYHPGEANFRMADVIVISKTDSALPSNIAIIERHAAEANPTAELVRAALRISGPPGVAIRGRRALVIEDGPTVTHGGLSQGAGLLFAQAQGAQIVDAKPHAVGRIASVYQQYPHLQRILPAMGYGAAQLADLEATIRASGAEVVVDGSPVDLGRLMRVDVPIVRVNYDYEDLDHRLERLLERFLASRRGPSPWPARPTLGMAGTLLA